MPIEAAGPLSCGFFDCFHAFFVFGYPSHAYASVLSCLHMLRLTKRLFGLPVHTAGGTALGQVADFEIDTETGRLQKMHVKAAGLVKGLMNHELIVDWSQMIEIREDAVIVDDAVVKDRALEKSLIRDSSPATLQMTSDLSEAE